MSKAITTDRRKAPRRAADKKRETAIATVAERSEQALGLIQGHIKECAENYTELRNQVTPLAAWYSARLKRAEMWGRLADKATDKILDRVIWAVVVVAATAVGGAKIGPWLAKIFQP